jgi:hypothetical protein
MAYLDRNPRLLFRAMSTATQCRGYAATLAVMAAEAKTPDLKDHLLDLSRQWEAAATELEPLNTTPPSLRVGGRPETVS